MFLCLPIFLFFATPESCEHVLHGEVTSANRERVLAALGLRARAREGSARPRQRHHLHLHQGGLSRCVS